MSIFGHHDWLISAAILSGCMSLGCDPPYAPASADGGRTLVENFEDYEEDEVGRSCHRIPTLCNGCEVSKLGEPSWQLSSFHFFIAPRELSVVTDVIAPTHSRTGPAALIDFAAPHSGPYARELIENTCAADYPTSPDADSGIFSAPEYWRNAVWYGYVLTPGTHAPTGSSPESANGRVIPNSLFPLRETTVLYRDGGLFDSGRKDKSFPGLDQRPNSRAEDGYSHYVEVSTLAPGISGNYEYQLEIIDSMGNGWKVSAPFELTYKRRND